MTPRSTEYRELFKRELVGAKWRWVAFFAIYFVSGLSGSFLSRLAGAPSYYPGSDPPWYFIRQDFFHGAGSMVGILVIVIMLALTWRRESFSNWFLALMVAIWMVPSVVTAIIIYWRCTDFFDYGHAGSHWPTFDSYLQSSVKFVGIPVGVGIAVLIGLMTPWRRLRERVARVGNPG